MVTETLVRQEIEGRNYILIDGIKIRLLPDCPKCGANEYSVSGDGLFLICSCGAKFNNRNKV